MTTKIAVVPGDGIGPEVIAAGLEVLEVLNKKDNLNLSFDIKDWGANKWLNEGIGLPAFALQDLKSNYKAIYFGALGDPRIKDMAHGREILLGLRFGLDLFINLRPIKLFAQSLCPLKNTDDVDIIIFRENTEDIYLALGRVENKNTPSELAIDESRHTYKGVERIIRQAFIYAINNKRKLVTLVHKSNAIKFGGDLWSRVFNEVAKEYNVASNTLHVDVAAMYLVQKPAMFDVIVTSNLFGDILSDLACGLVGGLGLASSGNIFPGGIGLFEPVHGSAPDIAGQGIANPLASFLSAVLMLEFLDHSKSAASLQRAVIAAIQDKKFTPDLGGSFRTQDITRFVCDYCS